MTGSRVAEPNGAIVPALVARDRSGGVGVGHRDAVGADQGAHLGPGEGAIARDEHEDAVCSDRRTTRVLIEVARLDAPRGSRLLEAADPAVSGHLALDCLPCAPHRRPGCCWRRSHDARRSGPSGRSRRCRGGRGAPEESMSNRLVTSPAQHAGPMIGGRRDCPAVGGPLGPAARDGAPFDSAPFDRMWSSSRPFAGRRDGRLPTLRVDLHRRRPARAGFSASARRAVSRSSRTVPATSGGGGGTRTRRPAS